MKKVFFFLFITACSVRVFSQVIWLENFSSAGTWNLSVVTGAEGANPNFFTVSAAEGGGITPNLGAPASCGVANNGNNTLHVTSVFNPTGGASYDAGGLCGFLFCPQTNRRAESPVINCTGYSGITLQFNYIENGQGTIDNATLMYYDGTTWAVIDDMPKTLTGCGGQGLWTSRTVNLPASANNNANVKIAFKWENNDDGIGTDPSFAVDDIVVSATPSVTNTITTLPSSSLSFCACDTFFASYTATGVFGSANMFQVQLSNASGSFTSPLVIGSSSSAALSGTITCVIPCTIPNGTAYRYRVVSTSPAVLGSDNGSNLAINANVTPAITITQVGGTVCSGSNAQFVATATNGGPSPSYQWKVNGINVGTSSSVYVGVVQSGDIVQCVLTSNAPCATTSTASSNTLVVNTHPPTIVTINSSVPSPICQGQSISLTATGGIAYSWTGGISQGTPFTPSASSPYTVTATDANGCSATSSTFVVVLPIQPLTTTLVCSPNPFTVGMATMFTASIPSGLSLYELRWYRNNVPFTVTYSPVNYNLLTSTGFPDSIHVVLHALSGCFTPDSIMSNKIGVLSVQHLAEQSLPDGVLLYPNPAHNVLYIESLEIHDVIEIIDMKGSLIYKKKVDSSKPLLINTHEQPRGLYRLTLTRKNKQYSVPIVLD